MREKTKYIVVHCSATKPSADIGAAEIDEWHKARGWREIGYHAVIRRDGRIEFGRPFEDVGAHVKGYNNVSVGVCLVGGINETGQSDANYTDDQWYSLEHLVATLKRAYPGAKIVGHNELTTMKDCPCFDVSDWALGLS